MKRRSIYLIVTFCLFISFKYLSAQESVTFKFRNGCGIVKDKQNNSWYLKGTCTINDLPEWAKNMISNKNDQQKKLKKQELELNKEGEWKLDTQWNEQINSGFKKGEMMVSASVNSVVLATMKQQNAKMVIKKSTDQGKTWPVIYEGSQSLADWKWVDHPNDQTIGVLADQWGNGSITRPVLLYSTNGGQSFTMDTSLRTWGSESVSLSMYDDKHWAVYTQDTTNVYRLHITKDGGKNWNTQKMQQIGDAVVEMRTPQKISLMGFGPTHISTDGGNTWDTYTATNVPPSGFLNGISFTSSDTAYVGARKDTIKGNWQKALIFKTTDGGKSWKRVFGKVLPTYLSAIPDGFFNIAFANKKEGLAFGRGAILRTRDGGSTWILDSIGSSLVKNVPHLYVHGVYEKNDSTEMALATTGQGVLAAYHPYQSDSDTSGDNNTGIRTKTDNFNNSSIAIFPNPAQSEVQIRWRGNSGVSATLYNTQGQQVKAIQLNRGVHAYNLSEFKAGMYILKVRNKNGPINKKVLISK